MLKLGVSSLSVKPPTWNRENAHFWQSDHCASAAEIFIGCRLVTRIPKWLPNQRLRHEAGTSTINATFAAGRKTATLRPRAKCQQQTPKTTAAPQVRPARIVWTNALKAQ